MGKSRPKEKQIYHKKEQGFFCELVFLVLLEGIRYIGFIASPWLSKNISPGVCFNFKLPETINVIAYGFLQVLKAVSKNGIF